jgi:hypothetical protein
MAEMRHKSFSVHREPALHEFHSQRSPRFFPSARRTDGSVPPAKHLPVGRPAVLEGFDNLAAYPKSEIPVNSQGKQNPYSYSMQEPTYTGPLLNLSEKDRLQIAPPHQFLFPWQQTQFYSLANFFGQELQLCAPLMSSYVVSLVLLFSASVQE